MKSKASGTGPTERKAVLASTLYSRILNLDLQPGETLNELTLCDEFGLSRSTVRTTLLQLQADGVLELHSGRAPSVVPMPVKTLERFEQSARLIYPSTAQLTALNARHDDHKALRSLLGRLDQALSKQDQHTWLSLENTLQRRIEQIAASPYLTPALRRLQIDHGRLSRVFYSRQAPLRVLHELSIDNRAWHTIIAAIGEGDCCGAAKATRCHLQTFCQRLRWHTHPLHKEKPAFSSLHRTLARHEAVRLPTSTRLQ